MTNKDNDPNKKVIYALRASDTEMTRYISGVVGESHSKLISRIRSTLKSSTYSQIGNATNRDINPAWNHHRQAFIDSRTITVELCQDGIPKRSEYQTLIHYVTHLNREALRAASKDFRVQGELRDRK